MLAYFKQTLRSIVAASEGNAAAIAAGYRLATGKVPAVYLQNSGEGNLVNPAASLLSRRVYEHSGTSTSWAGGGTVYPSRHQLSQEVAIEHIATAAGRVDLPGVARACGYRRAVSVETLEALGAELSRPRAGPRLIEVRCAIGSRENLGRLSRPPRENKVAFMTCLAAADSP